MEMIGTIVGDWIGMIHVITSLIAMILGGAVLLSDKGTMRHKRIGYAYTISMIIILLTAMMIYRLSGSFGPFHVIAIIGFIYLGIGIIPMVLKVNRWLNLHVYFMYWSVVGLYAAFVAELVVRIPDTPFWWMVGVGTLIVSLAGGMVYRNMRSTWLNHR